MLPNLCAEMARHEVKTMDISKVIRKTDRSVRLKVAGANAFTMPEAIAIRDAFFPEMTLEYLFARTNTGQSEAEKNALESGEATINSIRMRHGLPRIKGESEDVLLKKLD